MNDVTDTAVLAEVRTEPTERIECIGICHNGPIDDSPKALRYAADHDPEAPAAFLFICSSCDSQWPLCEKKVDSLLEWSLLRGGYMKCNGCARRVLISEAVIIPLQR